MDNLPNTLALWQLARELLELGVEMNFCRERSELYYEPEYPFHNIPKLLIQLIRYRPPWTKFHRQIFSGYTVRFPKGPVSQFNTHAQNVLEFLFWLTKHDIEIPNPLEYSSSGYESETRPWHGFKIILNALRSYEDFGIGMLSKFRFKGCRNDVLDRCWYCNLITIVTMGTNPYAPFSCREYSYCC
jgi:hypothetical protein